MPQVEWEDADTGWAVDTGNHGRYPDLLPVIHVRLDNFIHFSPYHLLSVLDG
jgi:hypothetical protein